MYFPTICCLCPTYGRPKLLANAIACFLAQDYPIQRRKLIIWDDLGTIEGYRIPVSSTDHEQYSSLVFLSTKQRFPSLPEKFNAMWRFLAADLYVVWEDDDIQFPWCLKAHAQACEHHGWSHPSHVWSDYGGTLHTEPVGGRFHGSLAIRGDSLHKIEGWPLTRRADFDQQLIRKLYVECGQPGDPCLFSSKFNDVLVEPGHPLAALRAANIIEADDTIAEGVIGLPPYCFRWQTGYDHGQGYMRGPDDESWYDNYQPPDRTGPHVIVPALDAQTKLYFDLLTTKS